MTVNSVSGQAARTATKTSLCKIMTPMPHIGMGVLSGYGSLVKINDKFLKRILKMAGADYVCCEECSKRLCYDGYQKFRDALEWQNIFCEACIKKLKKKIALLEKHDRRKH